MSKQNKRTQTQLAGPFKRRSVYDTKEIDETIEKYNNSILKVLDDEEKKKLSLLIYNEEQYLHSKNGVINYNSILDRVVEMFLLLKDNKIDFEVMKYQSDEFLIESESGVVRVLQVRSTLSKKIEISKIKKLENSMVYKNLKLFIYIPIVTYKNDFLTYKSFYFQNLKKLCYNIAFDFNIIWS